MLQKLVHNKNKLFKIIVLIAMLIAIRLFEGTIFYDPFLEYYKSEYAHLPFPQVNIVKLFLSYGLRFYLNMIISLGLIYVIFEDRKLVKFSIFLFMLLASLLMISFFFVLISFGEESKMTLFYIRRFIIQPLFLILFLAAFYYQKKAIKANI